MSEPGATAGYCTNCGAPRNPTDRFCGRCGTAPPGPPPTAPSGRALPLVPCLLAMVGLGVAALSIFGLTWVDGYAVSAAAELRCVEDAIAGRVDSVDDCALPRTNRVEMTRADIADFFAAVDAAEDPDISSDMTPVSVAFYRWGAIAMLVVTAGAVLLWMVGAIPASIPTWTAAAGGAWYLFALLEWLQNIDWDLEWVGLGGLLTFVGFALTASFMAVANDQQARATPG